MSRYMCPCSNVTAEMVNADQSGVDHINQLKKAFEGDEEKELGVLSELLNSEFLSGNVRLETREYKSKLDANFFDSHLKFKYPLLIGSLNRHIKTNDINIILNKCLVCDVYTHCAFVQKQSIDETVNNTDKKSVLQNRHFSDKTTSSHSPINHKNADVDYKFCFSILANNKHMIIDPNADELKKKDNYSSVYDLMLDNQKAKIVNSKNFDDLILKLNEVPIFEQRRFLNQINEKYQLSQNKSAREEAFKKIVDNLVNVLLNKESENSNKAQSDSNNKNSQIFSQTNMSNQNSNTGAQLTNKIQYQSNEPKKYRKKYDENALSSSVFEMEEIDELDDDRDEKFLNDQDSQDDDEPENQKFQKSILKKRNSNIGEFEAATDTLKTGAKMNFNRPDSLNSSMKYSCSVPRDIPIMHHRQNLAKTLHYVNNENYYNPNKEQQSLSQSITGSYKQSLTNYDFSKSNDEDNDDLFVDDNNEENFDLEDDDTNNMGRAISTLASSIVIKDGRELFGGVPSRRVPINSISKSCYE